MSDADLNYSLAQADALPDITSPGTSLSDAFRQSYEASARSASNYAAVSNMAGAMQDHLDMVQAKTGQTFDNPLVSGGDPTKLADQLQDLAQDRNDSSLELPSPEALVSAGIQKARGADIAEAIGETGPQARGAGIARLIGSIAGQVTDPEVLALNALGFAIIPETGPFGIAALRTAAGFGAGQLASTATTFGYKQAISPAYGFGDAAKEVLEAAELGAGTTLAGAGFAALWRNLRSTAPSVAAAFPQPLQDAGNVAERQADLDANNPFRTGFAGEQANRNAITQMSMDLAEGKAPEFPPDAQAEAKVPTGQVFNGNRAVDVKYELAEARDLVTSHDDNFMVNPAYPAELQPRDRANVASRAQVVDMAANLEPERLGPSPEANSGAPLVGPDNVVESGNGRAMAVRTAYGNDTDRAGAYQAFLDRSGYDTSGFENPVLIARRTTPMAPDERAAFAQSANASPSLRMSTTEQAMSDARYIDSGVAQSLHGLDIGSAGNREAAAQYLAKVPSGERGAFLTQGGSLSADGVRRLRAASVARAYGDATFVARAFEHPDPNIKTLAGALTDAAPEWIKLREGIAHGDIPSTSDMAPDLMNAVKAIMKARDSGRPVHEILNQGDMFHSDVSGLAAQMFFKDAGMKKFLSRADMADALSTAARDIRTSAEGGPDMFGAEPIAPKEALAASV
ncbi:MAG: hypothetical protein WBD78_11135 [Methylocella sp.]